MTSDENHIFDRIRETWPNAYVHFVLVYRCTKKAANPLPANSLGQRWWKFVIGSGAARNAGFVVIARVAAVDSKEIKNHIDRIQSIIGELNQSLDSKKRDQK